MAAWEVATKPDQRATRSRRSPDGAVNPKAGPVPAPTSAAAARDYSAGPHLAAGAPADAVEAVDAEMFRQALGNHPAGVAIITLRGPSGPGGLTVTSFSSA